MSLSVVPRARPEQRVAVAACGITNQRETTVLWRSDDGQPCGPALVWQDRRTASICSQWREQQGAEPVKGGASKKVVDGKVGKNVKPKKMGGAAAMAMVLKGLDAREAKLVSVAKRAARMEEEIAKD